ncbi:MAG: hypothetical protein BYD32DRAFT_411580 [Podila humilis]|nr:MAG: hypothetical protein BYD32DRAFT_411580 [Podila humilis]
MIRFSVLFLAVATAFAVASAVPFLDQQRVIENFGLRDNLEASECITVIKEYHPFQLWSTHLSSFVSRELDDNVLVGGIDGDKNLRQLEFCVVTDDRECSTDIPSSCISENIPYRFRVNGPVQGYLQIEGPFLRIIEDFDAASGLELQKSDGNGLHVVHMSSGVSKALTVFQPGRPLVLDHPKTSNTRQVFELLQPNTTGRKVEFFDNACVPETTIREYHPFLLKSSNLGTLISKQLVGNYLVGGIPGNKNFQELELCIVSSDYDCNAKIKSNCIYRDIEYRFRVNSPVQGYLRIVGNQVEIVKDFKNASGLTLYREAGWGLRVAHWTRYGERTVFAARYKGGPILMEEMVANAEHQWFELIERS